ncbi:MAG: tyrosine-protein kinase family protein [Candidatus Brocadiales bacterium]
MARSLELFWSFVVVELVSLHNVTAAFVGSKRLSIIEKALEKQNVGLMPPEEATRPVETSYKKKEYIDERIVTYHKSNVLIAEHFRQIKRLLQSYRATSQSGLFAFTSALRDEGTSTVTVNLAAAFLNGSACLVDANLIQPSIHRLLGIRPGTGLTDVLAGKSDLRGALSKCPGTGLCVLTAGRDTLIHPEAIASQAMYSILMELKKDFEYVLIDVPPVLVNADSTSLCSMVDGVAVVINMQRSKKKPVGRALEMLQDANILGFILCKGKNITYDYLGLTLREEKKLMLNGDENEVLPRGG